MGTQFNQIAFIQDGDAIRHFDGAESMGDDDGGAVLHQAGQGFLYQMFTFAIEAGSGFIQQQDARVLEDGAGDGNPLTLPTTEADSALTHDRLILIR